MEPISAHYILSHNDIYTYLCFIVEDNLFHVRRLPIRHSPTRTTKTAATASAANAVYILFNERNGEKGEREKETDLNTIYWQSN